MSETKPKMDFYFARTGNSLRAAIALELSNCPFERHQVDLANKEQKSKAFLDVNPAGQVPVLVLTSAAGRTALPQSGAIMSFLLQQYRQDLFPKDDIAKAMCNASFLAGLSDIAGSNTLIHYLTSEHPDAVQFVLNRMMGNLHALFLPTLDTPYLCGENKTIADYAHFPVVYMRQNQLRKAADAAHIVKWLERMQSDPAIAKALEYSGPQVAA